MHAHGPHRTLLAKQPTSSLRLLAARERVVSRERLPCGVPRLSFVSMVANAKGNGTMHVIERGRGNGQVAGSCTSIFASYLLFSVA